jgi:signal transduction histidine kinase
VRKLTSVGRPGQGLQAKMTTSYVLVTAAAVVLVEAVLLAVLVPRLTRPPADPGVGVAAARLATEAGKYAGQRGALPAPGQLWLGTAGVDLAPGQTLSDPGAGVVIGQQTGPYGGSGEQPRSLALLLGSDGRVVNSSFPAQYPPGARPGGLPAEVDSTGKGGGVDRVAGGWVRWLAVPVRSVPVRSVPAPTASASAAGVPGGPAATKQPPAALGTIYVQVPTTPDSGTTWSDLTPLVRLGLLVLLLSAPAGVAFGLLATRRLVRRLRRLAEVTARIADGDLRQRLPVTGADEVSQLEHSVNVMAERLDAAMLTERRLAGAAARHGERSRIARELHDSISQDLFSMRLLAGGLRRALPAGSPLLAEVVALARTADSAVAEMQALLLELRPVALDELGLPAALRQLCASYQARLGVPVEADLRLVELPPAVEHAVLRVAQEAIANAVRHADPGRIQLTVAARSRGVVVEVVDDGVGFEPADRSHGPGLGLATMRERVEELGGSFAVRSEPGGGSRVRAVFPAVLAALPAVPPGPVG